ncbi:MAG: protein kinase [Victivallales bacterium]
MVADTDSVPPMKFTKSELPRILVIDDEEPIRKILRAGLSEKYHVETAASAVEAADKINQGVFNIIICDLYMPEFSGREFFAECRKVIPEVPFIILTGQPKFTDAINFVKDGAFYYLTKPIDFSLLHSLVDKALAEQKVLFNPADTFQKSEFRGYKIIKSLGAGNSGTVLLGEKDGNFYAIKILRKDLDPENYAVRLKRFMQESDILKQINHPNIVKLFEFNHDDKTNAPYIIMEYISGKALSLYIKDKIELAFDQKLYIINQIAYALDYVHQCGVLHRDVKPENILITENLTVKLTDFGICKTAESGITMTGDVMGSPAYMSPESFDSAKTQDQRSDIFSLGVICYELFTGVRPFQGDSFYQLLESIREKKPEAPRKLNPQIPNWLQDVMGKMLDKNPDKRFGTAAEVMKAVNFYINEANSNATAGSITTRILKSMLIMNNVWK